MDSVYPVFPTVQGENLERKKVVIPRDLEGVKNVLLVAFKREHQSLVDSWVPKLRDLLADRSDVVVYEIPVLSEMNPVSRFFIDTAMRVAIPERRVRETTITLYLDREKLIKDLNISDFETIVPMVIEPGGQIVWRGRGGFDQNQFEQLKMVLG